MSISSGAGDKWEGAIGIPTQGLKAFPLADIVVKDSGVSFAMKGVPGEPRFHGTLSPDAKALSGEFLQGGASLPFALTRTRSRGDQGVPASTAVTKEIEGSWEGAVDVDGTTLRLGVTLHESHRRTRHRRSRQPRPGRSNHSGDGRGAEGCAPHPPGSADRRPLRGGPRRWEAHRHVDAGAAKLAARPAAQVTTGLRCASEPCRRVLTCELTFFCCSQPSPPSRPLARTGRTTAAALNRRATRP